MSGQFGAELHQHWLMGSHISHRPSPNHGGTFKPGCPDTLVIHYTAGASADSSVESLCQWRTRASAHVVIARDGRMTQLVPFNVVAWHAGRSWFDGRRGWNAYALGLELDNAGRLEREDGEYHAWFGKVIPEDEVLLATHRFDSRSAGWHRFTSTQLACVRELCALLCQHYPITRILGHDDIARGRKWDPGPAFPMDALRQELFPGVEEPAD